MVGIRIVNRAFIELITICTFRGVAGFLLAAIVARTLAALFCCRMGERIKS
jgi:hypothetical protein